MRAFLACTPSRELSMSSWTERPTIVHTDASDVPGRPEGHFIVGGLLDSPRSSTSLFTCWVVPNEVVSTWIPKEHKWASWTSLPAQLPWTHGLRSCKTLRLHFVDNDSATACLVKNNCPQVDSCKTCWRLLAASGKAQVSSYIDRVESRAM